MKKRITRLYKWIILSVTLQLLLLIFIDAYVLGSGERATTTSIASGLDAPKLNYNGSVKIPEDAVNIKISYNKNFACYLLKDKLIVFDISKKENVKEISATGKTITYYRWMSDRNILIYATRFDFTQNCEVEVTTLDVENDRPRVLPKITKQPLGSQINSIELSHFTSAIYAKVLTGKIEKIYSFDRMNEMEYVTETSLGAMMKETNLTDNLLIDDEKGKIKIWSGTKKSINNLDIKEKCVLLGISSKDEIFLGVLDKDSRITVVKKGKMEQNTVKTWENINLDAPKEAESFIVTDEGKVYYNDIKISTVFEIKGNQKKQYDGKLVEIKGDTLITQSGNKLKIIKLQ